MNSRSWAIPALALVLSFLGGCSELWDSVGSKDETSLKAIFPLAEGNQWIYSRETIKTVFDFDLWTSVTDTVHAYDTLSITKMSYDVSPSSSSPAYYISGVDNNRWYCLTNGSLYTSTGYLDWQEYDMLIDYPQPTGTYLWDNSLWDFNYTDCGVVCNADTDITIEGKKYAGCYAVEVKYGGGVHDYSFTSTKKYFAHGYGVVLWETIRFQDDDELGKVLYDGRTVRRLVEVRINE